jgi:hypothetical protein
LCTPLNHLSKRGFKVEKVQSIGDLENVVESAYVGGMSRKACPKKFFKRIGVFGAFLNGLRRILI